MLIIITVSDRDWNYDSIGIKKLIFDQKSTYNSCKLSRRTSALLADRGNHNSFRK